MASTCQSVLAFRKFVLAFHKSILAFHKSILALQKASEQFGCFRTNVHQLCPYIPPFSSHKVRRRQRDACVLAVVVVVDNYEVSLTVIWRAVWQVQVTRA